MDTSQNTLHEKFSIESWVELERGLTINKDVAKKLWENHRSKISILNVFKKFTYECIGSVSDFYVMQIR